MNKPNSAGNNGNDQDGNAGGEVDVEMNDEGLDIFYEGDKQHNPVVHGWIQRDIEHNHCAESLAQIRDHPNTTMLAVTLTSDRTTREGGADAISDALESRGWINTGDKTREGGADAISDALESRGWINTGDKTRVLTPTPAMGSSANVAIHPFTNVIADCSPELMDRLRNEPVQHTPGLTFYCFGTTPAVPWFRMALTGLQKRTTPDEIKEAFSARILSDPDAVRLIERSHDLIPGNHKAEFILKVALHFTEINTCTVHPTQNSPPQTGFRIYMPPLTKDFDNHRALTEYMASRTFSFDVPGRGRATPWLGNLNTPKARPMDCPILNSAGYRSTHNITNVDSSSDSEIATTLSLVTTAQSNQATTSNDNGSWQMVRGSYRGAGRIYRRGYNRGFGYDGYGRGGRGSGRGF
ncbi:hypothetical protein B0H13DRAFT_1862106 [Mycena leptocephala]|nr:hypothetical protein B0H13DRAFT_1862106 [Mycena leptocephala]